MLLQTLSRNDVQMIPPQRPQDAPEPPPELPLFGSQETPRSTAASTPAIYSYCNYDYDAYHYQYYHNQQYHLNDCHQTYCHDDDDDDHDDHLLETPGMALEMVQVVTKKYNYNHNNGACRDDDASTAESTQSLDTLDSSVGDDDVRYLRHAVQPTDTLPGICLRYGVGALALRRANGVVLSSSTSLAGMPNPLRIPLPPTPTTTSSS